MKSNKEKVVFNKIVPMNWSPHNILPHKHFHFSNFSPPITNFKLDLSIEKEIILGGGRQKAMIIRFGIKPSFA